MILFFFNVCTEDEEEEEEEEVEVEEEEEEEEEVHLSLEAEEEEEAGEGDEVPQTEGITYDTRSEAGSAVSEFTDSNAGQTCKITTFCFCSVVVVRLNTWFELIRRIFDYFDIFT